MTTSVLELTPTGGYTGWERMGLGYDASPPIVIGATPPTYTSVRFSLVDAAVAGVIDKVTLAQNIEGNQSGGVNEWIRGEVLTYGIVYQSTGDWRHITTKGWQTFDFTTNPSTGVAWTWEEIDALEAGLQANVSYGGWLRLYQFKAQVTYTPEEYVPPMLVKGNPAVGCGSMIF